MRCRTAFALLFLPGAALAVPGPDSTVVVASSSVAESLQLGQVYAEARGLPDSHVCTVPVDDRNTIDFAEYIASFETPLLRCLQEGGIEDRIEAFVIARGLPIRVAVPSEDGNRRVALAALLGVWTSRIVRGERLAGQAFGVQANCGGTPCYAARYANPYTNGIFSADWSRTSRGIEWRPKLVTMLHGRSYEQAQKLIASATTAEARSPTGRFVFMQGANAPRAVLDAQYQGVGQALEAEGLEVDIVPFDANLTFAFPIAGFFTGTQSIGDTIEANDYAAGSLVDNLTSLGAVPNNFTADGESQVSIARWIERGAAGVHGCTDEPLNNVFPNRALMTDYAQGFTLAESFFRRMPFVYWRNLVLGDPMTAPYATRPQVRASLFEDASISGGTELSIEVVDERALQSVTLYLDGVEIERVEGGDRIELCLETAPDGPAQLLAVAQVAASADPAQPKGWIAVDFSGDGSRGSCEPPPTDMGPAQDAGGMDMGPPDAGASTPDFGTTEPMDMGARPDAGSTPSTPITDPEDEAGSGCSASGAQPLLVLMLGLLVSASRRRRSA
ncbi:MAG: TIGR03790 family protein [Myxococcota bacterium]